MHWMKTFRIGKYTLTLGGIKPYIHFRKYRPVDTYRASQRFERFMKYRM